MSKPSVYSQLGQVVVLRSTASSERVTMRWILRQPSGLSLLLPPFPAMTQLQTQTQTQNAEAISVTVSSMDAISVPLSPRALMDDQGQQLPLLYNHRFLASMTTLFLANYPS